MGGEEAGGGAEEKVEESGGLGQKRGKGWADKTEQEGPSEAGAKKRRVGRTPGSQCLQSSSTTMKPLGTASASMLYVKQQSASWIAQKQLRTQDGRYSRTVENTADKLTW